MSVGVVDASSPWATRFLSLPTEDRLFVLRCGINGSGKYAAGEPYLARSGVRGLWEDPERLGLLVCEGSYSWSAPGFVEGIASLVAPSPSPTNDDAVRPG